jgi:NitT/TauT family transport system ATP-binding protein
MRLRCRNLWVSFRSDGREVPVLRDLAFEAGQGEFLTVVGPSGCGKTTLLRTIAGLIRPQVGEVQRIITAADTNQQVLLVFQEDNLFPWMTALENAAFGLEMQGVAKAERERRAGELLRRYGMAGRERAYPHELSLGMKQRVAVIRCFLSDPAVLLMDEPFGALDVQTRLKLQQELLDLWEQNHKTVVFVTHDCEEAVLLSDRVLVLSPQPARLIAEVRIPFPRPRAPELTLEGDFLTLKREIARKLGMVGAPRLAAPGAGRWQRPAGPDEAEGFEL